MSLEIHCTLVVRNSITLSKCHRNDHYHHQKIAGVMKLYNYEDILRTGRHKCQVSLFLFFLISLLGVNMLVKGSLLIRALNGLTSPNPIQWTFYTANSVCPPHDCMQCFRSVS